MKLPAFQFYTGDWLKDPRLSLCAPETRGVWIDLICAMHELNRSGELCATTEQLARLARCSTVQLTQALTDLQTTGAADVTDRNGAVTVVCRRMNREYKLRESQTLRQQRFRSNSPVTLSSRESHSPSSSSVSTSTSSARASPPDAVEAAQAEPPQNGEEELKLKGNGHDPPQGDSLAVALWKDCWNKAFGTHVEVRPADGVRLAAACAGRSREACEAAFTAFFANSALQSKTVQTFLAAEIQRRAWKTAPAKPDPSTNRAEALAYCDRELASYEPSRAFWTEDTRKRVQQLQESKAKLEAAK